MKKNLEKTEEDLRSIVNQSDEEALNSCQSQFISITSSAISLLYCNRSHKSNYVFSSSLFFSRRFRQQHSGENNFFAAHQRRQKENSPISIFIIASTLLIMARTCWANLRRCMHSTATAVDGSLSEQEGKAKNGWKVYFQYWFLNTSRFFFQKTENTHFLRVVSENWHKSSVIFSFQTRNSTFVFHLLHWILKGKSPLIAFFSSLSPHQKIHSNGLPNNKSMLIDLTDINKDIAYLISLSRLVYRQKFSRYNQWNQSTS